MASLPVPINNLNKATNQLPIAGESGTAGALGGIKADGTTIIVDQSTGVATAVETMPCVLPIAGDTGAAGVLGGIKADGTSILVDQTTGVASVGAAGSLVLLEKHTASNSATLDFTAWSNAGYDSILIVIDSLVPVSIGGVGLLMEVSTNGGVSWDTGANYQYYQSFYGIGTADQNYNQHVNQTAFVIWGGSLGNNWVGKLNAQCWLNGVNSDTIVGSFDVIASYTGIGLYNCKYGEGYQQPGPINGLRFLASSGNLSSGTIRVYGLKN
jgi:hypothetical protein